MAVRACRPYRARTKGKVENGVKYVKRNAIAGREFSSLDALQQHLQNWMTMADQRVHGTTGRKPIEAFQQQEAAALGPLPGVSVPLQRLRRTVANDSFLDLDGRGIACRIAWCGARWRCGRPQRRSPRGPTGRRSRDTGDVARANAWSTPPTSRGSSAGPSPPHPPGLPSLPAPWPPLGGASPTTPAWWEVPHEPCT